MAKTYSQYVCQQCGRQSPKAMGRCPKCGEWDSMIEEVIEKIAGIKKTCTHEGRRAIYSTPFIRNQLRC